jgi:hypothetical protein
MLTQDEEQRIRETVRKSLENILGEGHRVPGATPAPQAAAGLTDAERILAEETEAYYARMGLIKHVSRSGQVFWVTPHEESRLRERRARRKRRSWLPNVNPRVALVWGVAILLAILLVAYLVTTETVGGLVPNA